MSKLKEAHKQQAREHLQRAVEYAQAVVRRERPFYSLGALSMYSLTLIAEAPVIFARPDPAGHAQLRRMMRSSRPRRVGAWLTR